jgi:signal transduction histidine kinase
MSERLEQQARRIAHTLHDEVGQVLSAVYLKLDQVAREVPESQGHVRDMKFLLDEVERELRRLAHELRPRILDDLGLLPAIEFLANGMSERYGLTIAVQGSTHCRLPPMVETALYRIVQEALTNVCKHASAQTVRIRLWRDTAIHCSIQDDGVGCNPEDLAAHRGKGSLGLIGIRERANTLNGTVTLHSAAGQGMEVLVTVPLEDACAGCSGCAGR